MKKTMFFLMLILAISMVSALDIVEIRDASWGERVFGSGFSIFTDKTSYKKGETVTIEDYQDINVMCDMLSVNAKIYYPNGLVLASSSKTIGKAGYITSFIKIQHVLSSSLDAGTYKITTDWVCDGTVLGMDGYKDANVQGAVSSFNLIGTTVTPPPPACSKQCNIGYKLVNPGSASCSCQQVYVLGDGTCSIGEPADALDCKPVVEEEPKAVDYTMIWYGVAAVVIVIGAIWLLKK